MNFQSPPFVGCSMRQVGPEQAVWAQEQFGHAQVGDSRRTARVVGMAARAAESPSGKISQVFATDKERQGAYDLLESGLVNPVGLARALGEATARGAANEVFTFVSVDGSSIAVVDRGKRKDFGSLGAAGGRGLKMVSALGITPQGVPLGLFSQVWWARGEPRRQSDKEKSKRNRKRKVQEKETRHYLKAIADSAARAQETASELWFQLDRGGDNRHILLKLSESGHRYTVRGSWDRLIEAPGGNKRYLRQWLDRKAPKGKYVLAVSGGPHRTARSACMLVRWAQVVLRLRNHRCKSERRLEVTAVWTREEGTCPPGEKPLNWVLLTNVVVRTFEEAQYVIFGYTQRWRIEEFHKTWKTGSCEVEQTQLRTQRAVCVWGTILAAVAVRIERLKLLSRTAPEQPASIELKPLEIRALILLKRQIKKRTEVIPDTMPTIGQATLWIAQLGGYMRQSDGSPPGAITIGRGLKQLRVAAKLLKAIEAERDSAIDRAD